MRDHGRSVLESLLDWEKECTPRSADMTLPVSSYEELLARVRSLTHETIQLQRELATPLDHNDNERLVTSCHIINTCDNARGVAWTTPASHHAPPTDEPHNNHRSAHSPSGAPGPASWQRDRACLTDTFQQQNGGMASNEEYSVATFLARIGVALDAGVVRQVRPANNKENVMDEPKEEDEKRTPETCQAKDSSGTVSPESDPGPVPDSDQRLTSSGTQTGSDKPGLSALYHGTWPVERSLWHSGPSSLGHPTSDAPSVVSFASGSEPGARRTYSTQQLGAKVEMVYSLLSMLGTHDRQDMSRTLLAMSSSPDSCIAMRQSGCLPLLVQLLHAPEQDPETRQRAAQALHNVVHSHPDDKRGRREARVLRLLEQVRDYCDSLRVGMAATAEDGPILHDDMERHPGPTIAALMKLSFDEEHRHAMCQLGGLHAVAELIQVDHEAHGSTTGDQYCVTLRRYAGMALTNLTFGDGTNKALLCSFRQFMRALVAQLNSPSEDLRQVTASVLRNLSWRADSASKQTLREVGAVAGLMRAAMEGKKESTLKSILSALWNLSAHCSMNKVDICAVEGALGFLVEMLSYKAPSKTLAIVENAGGILRNISSHIAVREDYRAILREHNCLQVLLHQLKSPSLTIVSNACGTLWNLSARCAEDQRALWEMGAASMLRSLVHSKHKMISMGSSAALKNLLGAKPNNNFPPLDSTTKGLGLPALPSLYVRKQRALEQELDQTLAETCDNIEPSTSPSASTSGSFERHYHSADRRHGRLLHGKGPPFHRGPVSRSDSRDSVTSTLSDSVYERVSRTTNTYGYGQVSPSEELQAPLSTSENAAALHSSLSDSGRIHSQVVTSDTSSSERRFLRRYCNSMREREERRKVVSMELSCEDNERHSLPPGTTDLDSFQHGRLGQIEEALYLSPKHRDTKVVPETRPTEPAPVQEDANDVRLGASVQLDAMSLRPSSPSKQSTKSILYDSGQSGQRSAFSPLAATPYSSSSTRTPFQHTRGSYSSVRNKYSDLGYEDAESQDQPVDYSLKYVEHPVNTQATKSSDRIKPEPYEPPTIGDRMTEPVFPAHRDGPTPGSKQNQNDLGRGYAYKNQVPGSVGATNKNMKLNVVYGDYAETDLDQPTDYSLKYPEEDEEDEFEKRPEGGFYEGADPIHEDTLKTYCTEGTPYETPYNFSTATSMSDLHCEPPTPHSEDMKEEEEEENPVKAEKYSKGDSPEKETAGEEQTVVKVEDASNLDTSCLEKEPQMKSLPPVQRPVPVKGLQSGLSSGLMSPEKPVQYCEEGTPGCFSRVSSLSSLSSLPVHTDNQLASAEKAVPIDKPVCKEEGTDGAKEESRGDREGKVVTFGGADHYAEETPLMFSRCSSLGSLSSFEQHSIHDDRSSVISDFSRRTSGIVSPSELPDSPTQTVPPSPRRSKPPVEFTSQLPEALPLTLPAARHQGVDPSPSDVHLAGRSNAPKVSVFEDDVAAFKEEDTPVEFSRATSLSSLTIDDEPKICNDAMLKEVVSKAARPSSSAGPHLREREHDRERDEGMEKQDVEKEKRELADCCELAPVSEGEEENDEDMLAACINIGMQNSRQRQSQNQSTTIQTQSPTHLYGLQQNPTRSGRPSGIPVKTALVSARATRGRQQDATGTTNKSMSYMEVPGGACEDAVRTYCTEGTPANISHAGSRSDLSVLSLPGDGDETEVRREEPRIDEDTEGEAAEKAGERPELSDDSSNFSGDNDNILAECIQSGMPKARSQPARRTLPQPGSISISSPSEQPSNKKITVLPSRRPKSHHLCGLDHGPRTPPTRPPKPSSRPQRAEPALVLPQCLAASDELETFATEGSPNAFSTRSSLSDLTVQSGEPGTVASCLRRPVRSRPVSEGTSGDIQLRFATEDTPLEVSHAASLSSLSIGEDEEDEFNTVLEDAPLPSHTSTLLEAPHSPAHAMMASDGSDRLHKTASSASEDVVTVLSRNGSLSSLSVDSFGSTEPTPSEQALLEQCINSGMPKSRTEANSTKGSRIAVPVGAKKKISISSLVNSDRVPLQKLELKPIVKQCSTSIGLETDLARLTLEDEEACNRDTEQIPKNGVDPSAVVGTEAAADADASTAVIADGSGHPNCLGTARWAAMSMKTENAYYHVPVTEALNIESYNSGRIFETANNTLRDHSIKTTLYGSSTAEVKKEEFQFQQLGIPATNKNIEDSQATLFSKTTLYESAVVDVKKELYHFQTLETSQIEMKCQELTPSPQSSTTDDNKSPLSSAESPLSDCIGDKRRKDADAMIASLDRMTEELLQGVTKNGESNVMRQSLVGSDTWNEDVSPNDVSFPSMSISAPLVASFRSDNREDMASALPELTEEEDAARQESLDVEVSREEEAKQDMSMTDSHLIELEAGRLAVAVRAEVSDMEHSFTSLNSIDLDAIKPPSMMGSLISLTTSLSGHLDNADLEGRERCNSTSLPPQTQRTNGNGTRVECRHSRKKSLPVGMMVRRALGNNLNGSMENLLDNASASSSCNSHLDNIKPPSAMEEVIDIVDMENSMISVASITSEVADSSTKDQSNSEQSPANSDAIFDLLKPAACIMADVYAAHYASTMSASVKTSSASDCLDNINPPSAFNDLCDLTDQESVMEPGTETICSDTEMITEDPAHTYTVDRPESPEGSHKTTPVPSDQYASSSADSTPKKQPRPRQLTPKQRRQLVKDRYRTYTIAAEEERRQAQQALLSDLGVVEQLVEDAVEVQLKSPVNESSQVESHTKPQNTNKITPKQRRQEDRNRFQTQVLDVTITPEISEMLVDVVAEKTETKLVDYKEDVIPVFQEDIQEEEEEPIQSQQSGIPTFRKANGAKTVKQKRAEAKERFRTRTLSEDNCVRTCESSEQCIRMDRGGLDYVEALLNITPEEFETLLEHDANIVINTLNETRGTSESSEVQSSDEMMLDCETLSLVSLESESDHNANTATQRPSEEANKCSETMDTVENDVSEDSAVLEEEVVEVKEAPGDGEDSESSTESEDEGAREVKGPRIIKPNSEGRTSRAESVDSNNAEECKSPKVIRGRRKALYSSPTARRPATAPSGLPRARGQSSIPIVPGNVRPTRASALRQTISAPTPRPASRTPPSGGASPSNTSPKAAKNPRIQQRRSGLKTPSPPSKSLTPRSSLGNASFQTPNNTPNTSYTTNNSDRTFDDSGTMEVDPRFKPPERQGTFTKDEPTTNASRTSVPNSPTKTRIPIPSSVLSPVDKSEVKLTSDLKKKRIPKPMLPASSNKPKFRRDFIHPSPAARPTAQYRLSKGPCQDSSTTPRGIHKAATIPGRTPSTRLPSASATRLANRRSIAGGEMKTSLSNQSLQSNDGIKASCRPEMTHQRSSSNCSLSSVTSGGAPIPLGKKASAKKEVTSKIASLWKKVEESKNKQKVQKKDTRVWITAASSGKDAAAEDENNSMADTAPVQRLVRSSTFEGLPSKISVKTEDVAKPSRGRIGMHLSKLTNKRGSKSNRNSGDFTGYVADPEFLPRVPLMDVPGVMVVQPITREGGEVWVHREERMNTASIEKSATEVVMRRKRNNAKSSGMEEGNKDSSSDNPKRLSRLGSFIRIDSSEGDGVDGKSLPKPPTSAIVTPFNYNPPPRGGSQIPTPVKRTESYTSGIAEDRQSTDELSTASIRVTTV